VLCENVIKGKSWIWKQAWKWTFLGQLWREYGWSLGSGGPHEFH